MACNPETSCSKTKKKRTSSLDRKNGRQGEPRAQWKRYWMRKRDSSNYQREDRQKSRLSSIENGQYRITKPKLSDSGDTVTPCGAYSQNQKTTTTRSWSTGCVRIRRFVCTRIRMCKYVWNTACSGDQVFLQVKKVRRHFKR